MVSGRFDRSDHTPPATDAQIDYAEALAERIEEAGGYDEARQYREQIEDCGEDIGAMSELIDELIEELEALR